VEPLTRGLPPPDPCSLCSLSTEFVEPPPEKTVWVRHWLPSLPLLKTCIAYARCRLLDLVYLMYSQSYFYCFICLHSIQFVTFQLICATSVTCILLMKIWVCINFKYFKHWPTLWHLLHPGPYLHTGQRGPGPGWQISRGGILKKLRLKYGMREKKGCPRERTLREIYTENIMFCLLSVFCVVFVFVFVFIVRSSNPYKVDTYWILNLSYTEIIQIVTYRNKITK
jgi:hypothetical protein